jgi:hypothetical protein
MSEGNNLQQRYHHQHQRKVTLYKQWLIVPVAWHTIKLGSWIVGDVGAADSGPGRTAAARHLVVEADMYAEKEANTKGWSHWPRRLRRGSETARFLGLQVRIPPGAWMSLSCECCEVEVSASYWPLVQISPTACGVSGCDREASIMRKFWPFWDCCALRGGEYERIP